MLILIWLVFEAIHDPARPMIYGIDPDTAISGKDVRVHASDVSLVCLVKRTPGDPQATVSGSTKQRVNNSTILIYFDSLFHNFLAQSII
jgi:hypothetical protein